MESPEKAPYFRPSVVIASGCTILFLLACLTATIFVSTGARLSSYFSKQRSQFASGSERISPPQSSKQSVQTAQIEELRGWVEVRDTSGEWSPASPQQIISAGMRLRTGGLSSASLLFPDGSRASLQASSELSIDELDVQKSGKRTIVLSQWTGESDHEVVPTKRKDARYEVHTPSGSGEAKGTHFQVIVTPEQFSRFTVVEGVVAVSSVQVTVLVNPGQFTTVYLNQPPLEPVMSVSGQGVVTQTGATWVIAGQEFHLTEQTILIGDPQVGDWVRVEGHLEEDGSQSADWVVLLHAALDNRFSLRGSVETIDPTEWVVDGQLIVINDETTIDEGIVEGNLVLVEGVILEGGSLQASKVLLINDDQGMPFEFTGVVETIDDSEWLISGLPIVISGETQLEEDLVEGDVVQVRGWIVEGSAWQAVSILRVTENSTGFQFTGILESMEPWQVAGIGFETREWTEIDPNLALGDLVIVAGTIDTDGTWIADSILRVAEDGPASLILVGPVISIDPWVVGGIALNVTEETLIEGEVTIGMLVRVEISLLPDGGWQVVRIQPLSAVAWFPSCMDIVATVISIDGNQIQLENWPLLTLDDSVQVEGGDLTPNSVIRFRICFTNEMTIQITYIVIIDHIDIDLPEEQGGKVLVCHKPNHKKGGHTISISSSAVPAHLGHGDYLGSCR